MECSVCQAQAEYTCSCGFPSFPVCAWCFPAHLEAPGDHALVPIQAASMLVVGNEVCDECEIAPAARFCLCTVPLRKFCKACNVSHYQKARRGSHSTHPMLAYESVTSGRVSIETFRTKQLYLNDIQARMWEELVLFDTFVKETDRAFSTLLTQITVKREAVLGDLQTNKAKLRTYLNAIQQTIQSKRYLESFEAVTVLDEYILSGYRSFHAPETKIFTGKMAFQEIFGLLEKCVSYEMQDSLILQESGHIPVLKGNLLRLFNRKTLHMSQLTLSHVTRIDYATAYCFLTPNTLLAVGGIGHSDV